MIGGPAVQRVEIGHAPLDETNDLTSMTALPLMRAASSTMRGSASTSQQKRGSIAHTDLFLCAQKIYLKRSV